MNKITPYLMFDSNCEEAIDFYKKTFDGKLGFLLRYKDTPMKANLPEGDLEKIIHAELELYGGTIFMSDYLESMASSKCPTDSNINLSINLDSVQEVETLFNKLKEEGTVLMDLEDAFWGDRFGMIQDKYKIIWMLGAPLDSKK